MVLADRAGTLTPPRLAYAYCCIHQVSRVSVEVLDGLILDWFRNDVNTLGENRELFFQSGAADKV